MIRIQFFAILLCTTSAFAELPQLIKLDGRPISVSVAAGEKVRKTFYALTQGNNSSMLRVSISAPMGTTLKAYLATVSGNVSETLKDQRRFFPLSALSDSEALELGESPCIDFSPGESSAEPDISIARPESSSPLCELFSAEDKASIGEALSALYGGSWSDSQICGYLVNNYFGGAEACDPLDPICVYLQSLDQSQPQAPKLNTRLIKNIFSSYMIRISRNACVAKGTKYILKIQLDLPARDEDINLAIRASDSDFNGDMAASIKPTSDGKFAPQPILLMSFLGSFCGQHLEISKWSSGKITSKAATEPKDLIPYNGHLLTRTPLGRFLSGGKGTFELFNGRSSYSVCFELKRKRQKVNGY